METIQHADGRVELQSEFLAEISRSPLYNEDLAPVPIEKRNWTTYNYAALWISMAHCIPTYMMASGLISAGMNWWQALVTILLGNSIVLAPILLNSHPGTKYGIPFPVFARAAYGTFGSNLPALMRAIVACGWFGIQAWIGGQAIHIFLGSIIPNWNNLLGGAIFQGHTPTEWLSFAIFWAMNIAVVYRGMNLLRHVENWAAPFVLVMTAILLAWILYQAGGIGFLLHEPGKFQTFGEFFKIFIPSLTAMIGFWATLKFKYARLYAFRKVTARTSRRAGRRAADDDGFIRRDGNFNHVGGSRRLPEYEAGRTLGPGEIGRTIFTAVSRSDFDVYDYRCNSFS